MKILINPIKTKFSPPEIEMEQGGERIDTNKNFPKSTKSISIANILKYSPKNIT